MTKALNDILFTCMIFTLMIIGLMVYGVNVSGKELLYIMALTADMGTAAIWLTCLTPFVVAIGLCYVVDITSGPSEKEPLQLKAKNCSWAVSIVVASLFAIGLMFLNQGHLLNEYIVLYGEEADGINMLFNATGVVDLSMKLQAQTTEKAALAHALVMSLLAYATVISSMFLTRLIATAVKKYASAS